MKNSIHCPYEYEDDSDMHYVSDMNLEKLEKIAEEAIKEKEDNRKMILRTNKLGVLSYLKTLYAGLNTTNEVDLSYWEEHLEEGWYTIDEHGFTLNK